MNVSRSLFTSPLACIERPCWKVNEIMKGCRSDQPIGVLAYTEKEARVSTPATTHANPPPRLTPFTKVIEQVRLREGPGTAQRWSFSCRMIDTARAMARS